MQPTHATSDMEWADERLGGERVQNAYTFKELLDWAGKVALGTDFPVEKVNPLHTFYAAVARKSIDGNPQGGLSNGQCTLPFRGTQRNDHLGSICQF